MTRMKYNVYGGRQKNYTLYMATTRKEELCGGHQKSNIATARREELSGSRQKSYEGQSKINESYLVSPKP